MRRTLLGLTAVLTTSLPLPAQSADEMDALVLRRLHDAALTTSPAYEHLRELTTSYPGRLSGTKALERALGWAEGILRAMALDHVWTLETPVPHWERGARESARLMPPADSDGEAVALSLLALGGSVATPPGGITAEVVEVRSLAELAELGPERIGGRIVFFNRPMDPRHLHPEQAYAEAGDQRRLGPFEAARLGAVAALVRSLTWAEDDHPHTGTTAYRQGPPAIPCAALGIQSANTLSAALAAAPGSRVELRVHAQWHPETLSHNVIGEIRGREFPDRIILVGAHLDTWDVTPGAHDNGAGVVQAIEVLRLFQVLELRPRHTLRCVLFTNEENGLRGAIAYAAHVRASGEPHLLAIESDSGGFAPRGFALGSLHGPVHERAARWRAELEPYGLYVMRAGPGGPDVGPLRPLGITVGHLVVESQRYFDYHHARTDTIDTVNPRELALGAAALASLVYLVDTHGL